MLIRSEIWLSQQVKHLVLVVLTGATQFSQSDLQMLCLADRVGSQQLMDGYIGSAQNLGTYFIPNFITMWIVGMMAMRVLQVWIYNNTNGSVLLIQLMHASSSGFLMVFTPSNNSPANEIFWFAVYAVVLWIVVAIVIAIYGKHLVKKPKNNKISVKIN